MMPKLDDIKDEAMGPNILDEEEEDEEEIECIEPDNIIFHCQRHKEGRSCHRNGLCIVNVFSEGKYDICEDLTFEDPEDGDDVGEFEGANN